MLLEKMTRLPEGAVGNDLLSGWAAAAAKKLLLKCWDRKTDIPDTHCLPPPPPLLQCYDTGDYTHLRLADTEVGTSQANVLFHSSHSHLLSVSPLSLSCIAIYLLLSLNASLSLSLSRSLSLSLLVYQSFYPTCSWGSKTSNGTFGQLLSFWQELKKCLCALLKM